MSKQVLVERFFETLISGHRFAARGIVEECFAKNHSAEKIVDKLFWPAIEMIHTVYRADQLSMVSHHYATRLLRMLADQMQLRLEQRERRGQSVLLVCGPNEHDELQGQLAADALEADGYDVYFAGGGVANDEIVNQIGELEPHALVMYGSTPQDLPYIRQLIDELREIGTCPDTQIVVGGGVFNRAEGLAEEIGADLWAKTPGELVSAMTAEPERRASADQRTVGRRRRSAKTAAA